MRGYWWWPLFGVLCFAWFISVGVAPDWQPLFTFLIILWCALRLSELEIYSHTHRGFGTGFSTTLATPFPIATVDMPPFENSPDLEQFGIWPMGGTHIGPLAGGRKNGFVVCPLRYSETIEGEEAQVKWNLVHHVYVDNPDLAAEERPHTALPPQVLDTLRANKTLWHKKSPVYFGWFPWQAPTGADIKGIDLQEYVDWQNVQIEKLKGTRTDLLDGMSQVTSTYKHVGEKPTQRNVPEDEERRSLFRRGGEYP